MTADVATADTCPETSSDSAGTTSLLERLASHAQTCPDKTAFTFLGNGPNGGKVERTLTYRQLADETDRVAAALTAPASASGKKSSTAAAGGIGLKKGDVVVLVYPPSLDFMVAFVACLKCGVVAVPVFPPHPARKDTLVAFTRIVKGCGARIALTSKTYNHLKKLGSIKGNFAKLKRPAGNEQDDAKWPDQLQWIVTDDKSLGKKEGGDSGVAIPSASDLAFLQFTSGSTSDPKGVMITHGNLSHNLSIITNELQAGEDTVVVSWLPQYHDMGLIGSYLGILYCGGSGYYMSPLSFLQRPMIWMEAVSKYKATHLQAPNFAFKLTSRKYGSSPEAGASSKLDLSSVRHIINGAEPVTADSIDTFINTFGPLGLNRQVMFPTYGLAEHTVFVCSGGKQRLDVLKQELEVDGVVKLATSSDQDGGADDMTTTLIGCGYPGRQGVDVRIVQSDSNERESGTSSDESQGKEVGEDVVGEIWIRSPSKAAGYWNNAEQTKEAFRASLGDYDKGVASDDASFGYLHTGDVGFLHKGELFICGRIKDLIIVGGRNYYPQDIEGTAQSVVDTLRPGCVAAFSVDPVGASGDDVALVAELREAPSAKDVEAVCAPIANEIRAAINQEHSLGVAHIVLLRPRTIPKTTSGKIARSWCRKAYIAASLNAVYKKSFRVEASGTPSFVAESQSTSSSAPTSTPSAAVPPVAAKSVDPEVIRNMGKDAILKKLVGDVCRLGSMSPDMVDKSAALITMLDSLSISQFKGMLEQEYATKLSDEYLFREDTTLTKLVEVVRLGYAPDDGGDAQEGGGGGGGGVGGHGGGQAVNAVGSSGGGLAGALGCPPG
eukprot:CAMPEP_0181045032 /NCGR_PEP_ID=MMETSP1070-20121207/13587_1 /TAXON_ID=265543 /ORGANISM="Minutocellus polymorphus, Strain NH13" /LENGTH=834 /DNA_ID=CAMNT_0023123525 /DNA_START=136 /DNA_END=2636 /DNA_ORIENTATION=-